MNVDINTTDREPVLAADARDREIRSLCEKLSNLLCIHCGGDFYAEIYPYGHERGTRLRNMKAPAMVIADLPYNPSREVPSPAGYRAMAMSLVGLEEPIERTFQLARVIDDYTLKVMGDDNHIDQDERANLITLTLMMREHGYSLRHSFHQAVETGNH